MKKDIIQVNKEVIKFQNDAAGNSDHPINDGLRLYFKEIKHKLSVIKNQKK